MAPAVVGAGIGVDFVVLVEVLGIGAIDRATRVRGTAVSVVGVEVGVDVAVSVDVAVTVGVAVSVGDGVGQPGGMVAVGVAVGVTVGVGVVVTVEVGVGDQVGQMTDVESVGNGSVALGEFSLGSGRSLVGVPLGVGSGLGFAEELGRLVGSGTGTGTGLIGWKLCVAESVGSVVDGAGLTLIDGTLAVWP